MPTTWRGAPLQPASQVAPQLRPPTPARLTVREVVMGVTRQLQALLAQPRLAPLQRLVDLLLHVGLPQEGRHVDGPRADAAWKTQEQKARAQ
jgi:hypothetical protein